MSIQTQVKRVMIFIDGDNISLRFQELLKEHEKLPEVSVVGAKPKPFIWTAWRSEAYGHTIWNVKCAYEVIRAYYYSYCIASADEIKGYIDSLKKVQVCYGVPLCLQPTILKKPERQAADKAKGDDITLCVDALHHAYNKNVDIVHLFTGDGDYLPLVKEIQGLGILVYVSAFSSGKNEELVRAADMFIELDTFYLSKKK